MPKCSFYFVLYYVEKEAEYRLLFDTPLHHIFVARLDFATENICQIAIQEE